MKIHTIDITTKKEKLLGDLMYETHPQIGEWVEIEIDGASVMFEVLMVVHNAQACGSDLYIRRISERADAIKTLLAKC